MKVKRYLVNDLPEAVQMIRSELGSDAVILNTKEIRTGGFLGMFRKKQIEVVAAVDEAAKPKPRPTSAPRRMPEPLPAASAGGGAGPGVARAAAAAFAEAGVALAEAEPDAPAAAWVPPGVARERYGRSGGDAAAAPKPAPAAAPAVSDAATEAATNILAALAKRAAAEAAPASAGLAEAPEARIERIEPGATQPQPQAPSPVKPRPEAARPSAAAEPEDETAALLREIRSMKEMMQKINRQQTFRSMPDEVMQLSRMLAKQGVEPAYVRQFAEEVSARIAAGDEFGEEAGERGDALATARDVLREWLLPAAGSGISETTRIVNFVGPTGVGKTTTIAKLAADQAFVHRRQVGFITADTYRIAAVDQLRTYADILNIPLEVVFSPSELSRAYKKLEDRDLLLMDTAGRNYRNELFVSEVNSLLSPGQQAESILVLSLTHKYDDMKQVADQFAKYGVSRLLLTKMDETDSVGAILNLVRDFDFEISYITCGQTVPDDIRPFDPDEIVGKLLGEVSHA